jgi:hypothetical protein
MQIKMYMVEFHPAAKSRTNVRHDETSTFRYADEGHATSMSFYVILSQCI